jgi:CubicO group peptidase (beta-lactamase class C family)
MVDDQQSGTVRAGGRDVSDHRRWLGSLDRMHARRLTVATAVLGVLSLAGCSGDEGPGTATPASGITSAATSAATESTPAPDGAVPAVPDDLPTEASDGTVYPGESWARAEPRELGFDAARMEAIAEDARPSQSTCLLVARKGKIVGEWNWRGVEADTPREVFSVTKSITSTLVGLAQEDGDLDITDPARRYIEDWRDTRSRNVTVRDLLSNVSGRFWEFGSDYAELPQAPDRTQYAVDLRQQYPPGKVWAYNNAAIQTLDRVISTATGEPTRDYAAERLFGPIGMAHTQMTPDQAGNTNTFFGTQTTCRDLARFGYLFLNQGRWGDDQVVPKAWVQAAVGRPSQSHNAAYGLLWWLNRRGPIIGPLATDAPGQPEPAVGQTMPGLSARAFSAQGLGGQVVLVDPETETVVVRLGQFQANPEDTYNGQDAARFITQALVEP